MKDEKKQDFTRRLSCCNRGEMIIIIYDILFSYLEDALEAQKAEDYNGFRDSVHKAQQVVRRLMGTLDFNYPVSKDLHALYRFINELLSLAIVKNEAQNIVDAKKVLRNLYDGFWEAAQHDTSEPLMQHTQQVVAGMTYQRGALTETLQGSESTRGFFA